jgi:hypothetical protein
MGDDRFARRRAGHLHSVRGRSVKWLDGADHRGAVPGSPPIIVYGDLWGRRKRAPTIAGNTIGTVRVVCSNGPTVEPP